jgi:hypothetical protein
MKALIGAMDGNTAFQWCGADERFVGSTRYYSTSESAA